MATKDKTDKGPTLAQVRKDLDDLKEKRAKLQEYYDTGLLEEIAGVDEEIAQTYQILREWPEETPEEEPSDE